MSTCIKIYRKWDYDVNQYFEVKCGRKTKSDCQYCGFHNKGIKQVVREVTKEIIEDRNNRPMTQKNSISITDRLMKLPVKKRFGYLKKAVKMVINGAQQSPTNRESGISGIMICGIGGIGKTHLVIETLNEAGLEQGKDWWKNSGKSSALGVYQLLYEHRDGGIVVLDDTDLWNDKEAMNIMKAALDTYGERVVSWNTKGADNMGLPRSFKTKASVIFITNRNEKDIPQPLKDRCMFVPLQVTRKELFERMQEILPNIEPKTCDIGIKQEVFEYLKSIRYNTTDPVSLRTLFMALKWRLSASENDDENDWKECVDLFV